ncbi:MAG: hypothetical protein IT376_06490 [Polyangiaceae bacterium]|nr:hypothetical protein [Polyangiaceae bacterium]
MRSRSRVVLSIVISASVLAVPALAAARPVRRATARTELAERAAAARAGRSPEQQVAPVVIVGRRAQPQVVVEIPRVEHQFEVGTARHAPSTRRFMKRGRVW